MEAPRWPRPSRRRWTWVVDGALATALTVLNVSLAAVLWQRLPAGSRALAVAATAVLAVAMTVRRRWPRSAFAALVVTALVLASAGVPMLVMGVAPLLLVFSVATALPLRQAWAALAVVVVTVLATEALGDVRQQPSTVVGNLLALATAWLAGVLNASRQRYVTALEVRTAELEEARQELARQAVADERLRIARELHDIVAHALSVITIRSGVGGYVAADRPEEAREALAAIEVVGRRALDDMRRLVDVLRTEANAAGPEPLPGVDDLPRLVEQISAVGPAVQLEIAGVPTELDAGRSLAVYRLVQEALTNVVKHAHAQHVEVVVRYGDDAVEVVVTDDGRGPSGSPDGGGHGHRGMRERATLYGGTVDVGSRPGGGFVVRASIPLEGPRS